MTTTELPKLLHAQPFIPFSIRTADGREVLVKHPDAVAYDGGRIALVLNGDDFEIIDLLLVPSLRVAAGGREG